MVAVNLSSDIFQAYTENYIFADGKCVKQGRIKKACTSSNVDGVVAIAIGLVPDCSRWTRVLATRGELRRGIPDSALDVHGRVVVWVVVAVRHDVVVCTRVGNTAAELSNCNSHTHTLNGSQLAHTCAT